MAFHKALKDLNLLDRFLFAEAMEDPVIMQTILEIILGKDILLKYPPQAEKEKRSSPLFRFIRMDVWAMDAEDTVYDAEVQKEDTKNLPKRSRLYQSMIDTKLLDPGEVDFGRMNNVYTIMIAPFDLFGKGLYRYTFRMRCDEDPGIALDDGAARIFLNTRGKDPSGVSEELIELLRYIEHTTEEVSSSCRSGKRRSSSRGGPGRKEWPRAVRKVKSINCLSRFTKNCPKAAVFQPLPTVSRKKYRIYRTCMIF